MKAPDYEAPSWKRIHNMLLRQSQKISKSGFKPEVIVGISRGGWVPARVLSDLLENPNLANIKVECYRAINQPSKSATLTQSLSVNVAKKKVLIVDDVADSGRSLQVAAEHAKERGAGEVKTATLYYKSCSTLRPDYYEEETDCWVVFPWETKETVKSIRKKLKANPTEIKGEIAKLMAAGVPKHLINRFMAELSEDEPC